MPPLLLLPPDERPLLLLLPELDDGVLVEGVDGVKVRTGLLYVSPEELVVALVLVLGVNTFLNVLPRPLFVLPVPYVLLRLL